MPFPQATPTFPAVEGGMALMPMIGRVRMLRSWGGIMDMSMDGSPIIDRQGHREFQHPDKIKLLQIDQ